jgi:hypothetical protein
MQLRPAGGQYKLRGTIKNTRAVLNSAVCYNV